MTMNPDVTLLIDPFTHHFERDALFDAKTEKRNGADILAPWVYLRQWFQSRGIAVHTADRLLRGEISSPKYVYVSFGLQNHYRALTRRPDLIASAFFAFESPVVEPVEYSNLHTLQKHFKRIFTFTDTEALAPFLRAPVQSQLFHLPYPFDSIDENIWARDSRKFLVIMNHNKLPPVLWHELYTERMRAVEFFARHGEIDLYGVGWEGPSFQMGPTRLPGTLQKLRRALLKRWQSLRRVPLLEAARQVYRGSVESKLETLAQYTFSLCFENVVLKGWVTEKIFDCLIAGTIPIYWGASDIAAFVPNDCFIDMRRFTGYRELRGYLRSLSEREIQRYRENGREYLRSPQFQPFTKQAFTEIMARVVEEDAGIRLGAMKHPAGIEPTGANK
jgi:alpha(1,3/1,4) fucosyltransferase